MNAEQKAEFNLAKIFIKPLLRTLIDLLGDYVIEFIKEQIAKIKEEDGEVTVQGDPTCVAPKIYNPITKTCVDPL